MIRSQNAVQWFRGWPPHFWIERMLELQTVFLSGFCLGFGWFVGWFVFFPHMILVPAYCFNESTKFCSNLLVEEHYYI